MVTANKTHEPENKGFLTGFMVALDGRRYGFLATFRRLAKPQFNLFATLSDRGEDSARYKHLDVSKDAP